MTEGRFIVLEGGDGVGKTTQAALLSSWLTAREIPHILAREPGGTPVGEAIREIVLDRGDLEMPAESELLLILSLITILRCRRYAGSRSWCCVYQ